VEKEVYEMEYNYFVSLEESYQSSCFVNPASLASLAFPVFPAFLAFLAIPAFLAFLAYPVILAYLVALA
jgi:hypothetical protein